MWHQIVRNIKSHDKSPANFVANGLLIHLPRIGYQITNAGRSFLRKNGRHR